MLLTQRRLVSLYLSHLSFSFFLSFFLLGGRGLCVCACIFRLDIRILSHSLSPLCSPNPITLDSFTIPRDYNRMPWPPPPRPCHAAGAVRAARGPSRNDFSYFFSLLSTSFYSHQHFVRAGAGRTYERKIKGIKPNVRKKKLVYIEHLNGPVFAKLV